MKILLIPINLEKKSKANDFLGNQFSHFCYAVCCWYFFIMFICREFDFTSFFSSFKIYVVWLFTFRFLNFLDVAMDFEIVSTEDCGAVPNDLSGASRTEMYVKLEKDLLEQIKMCQANRIYFKSTGDVPSTNKFHQVKFS